MCHSRYGFSALLLFVFCFHIRAQQLRFRHLTAEDGLASNFVRAILQDSYGFMWFGTQDGLSRYDGYGMSVFRHMPGRDSTLSSSEITCLVQAGNTLFVGTRNGLSRIDILTGRCSVVRPLGRVRINALLVRDSLTVLAGTGTGLAMIDAGSDSVGLLNFEGKPLPVLSLGHFDGGVYAGTDGLGLWRLGSDQVMRRAAVSFPEFMDLDTTGLSVITCIRQYGDRLYLGTNGAGIFKLDRSLEVQARLSFASLSPASDIIRDFIIRHSAVHAATAYGTVVCHLISGRMQHYTRSERGQSLNSNPCNAIYSDKAQNLWIGTDLGGVNVALSRSLRFPLSQPGFEHKLENVYAFAPAGSNGFFVGGDGLLMLINNDTGESADYSPLLNGGTARSLYYSDNKLWIGTWGTGLLRYDLRSKKVLQVLDGKTAGTILALREHNGWLYAASAGEGLFRISGTETPVVEAFNESNGLPVASINCIFRDSDSTLWLGTNDAGLVVASQSHGEGGLRVLRTFRAGEGHGDLPSNVIYAINRDNAGGLWVATSAGLSRLLPDSTFSTLTTAHGLPGNQVYALLRDSTGHFWAGTGGGLASFNPAVPQPQVVFRSYGQKDGLVNTIYHVGAAMSATSGLMYFGGPSGYNVFRPTSVKENLNPPPVYAVSWAVDGTERATDTLISFRRHMEIDWSSNNFRFGMAALDYTDPHKNLYSYKLEGYDADWSEPSPNRYAAFRGLPGGTYTFMVRAANNDGVWNERPWQITLTVVPPFWRTNAFLILVVMTMIAMMYGFSSLRTRAVRRENVVLEKKVAQRTRELEARNREITSSIEYARRIQEAILPSRDHIFSKLKKVFIFYRPKDIVSGDFYWFAEKNDIKIFAVVDCTGHGVPGAFMSMIGHNLLDQVVTENGITDPGEILNHLHRGVLHALRQGHNETDTHDGMDVSVIAINDQAREVRWAGANRPLILIDAEGRLNIYQGNKDPIGGTQAHPGRTFTTHIIKVEIATMAYLFTDGYADQFGGDRGKKFMVRRLHELLATVHRLSPDAQQAALESHFEEWRRHHEQVDDVLIAGIEI